MNIKKYHCRRCKITTSRKGLRKHLADYHSRNNFSLSETVNNGSGTWKREEFE